MLVEHETDATRPGSRRLRIARLLEPLDAINALVRQRLTGVECRTWMELDKWADKVRVKCRALAVTSAACASTARDFSSVSHTKRDAIASAARAR